MEQGQSSPNYDEVTQTCQHIFGEHNETSHSSSLAALEFIRNNSREVIPPNIALPPWHTYNFNQLMTFGRIAVDNISITEEGSAVTFSDNRDISIYVNILFHRRLLHGLHIQC
jgi:hypothetical protein